MTFPLDRIQLGPRAYGVRPKTYGVCFHTTEYPDSTMASALRCIRDQSPGGSLYAGGGSYNFLLTDDGPVLAVPYLDASGGISGDHTPPPQGVWAPDRFPWLKQMLPAEAYADPNAYLLQIAVSGKTSQLMTYSKVDRLAAEAARIILWAEELPEFSDNLVVMGHFNWQTNRSDPGQAFIDLVMKKYDELVALPPAPPTPSTPIPEPPSEPAPPILLSREDRLAKEVRTLRNRHPKWAEHWARVTRITEDKDGQPQSRENRLAAEALYLRLFDQA